MNKENIIGIILNEDIKRTLFSFSFTWAIYQDVNVQTSSKEMLHVLSQQQNTICEKWTLTSYRQNQHILETRQAFKKLGIDPSRYRPAQEALFRKILKGENISSINTAVDVNNLLSLKYQWAMGIYDLDKIQGALEIKIGSPGEKYDALNGRTINACQKLVLCDRSGPIGGPYVDSSRTAVNMACRNLLHVVYLSSINFTQEILSDVKKTIIDHNKGEGGFYQILTS